LCPREAACTARREHSASASESIAYAALCYAQKQTTAYELHYE